MSKGNQSLILVEGGVPKGMGKSEYAFVVRNGELYQVDWRGIETKVNDNLASGGGAGAVDVTAAPYNAVGNGMRLDTAVVNGTSVTVAGYNFTGRAGQYIRIVNAGVGGTTDHITQINSAANGSLTLLVAAPTAIPSNATIFFGTNNTTAIQSAINAAAASNSLIREVYIPPGIYLGNWTVPTEVTIRGAGGGMLANFESPTSAFLLDRTSFPTVLLPAVSTSPVLYYEEIFGTRIRDLMICGSAARKNRGLQLGDPTNGAVAYTGSNMILENVTICGFQYGLIAASVADMILNSVNLCDSTYNCYLGELTSGLGPADSVVFNSVIMGGPASSKSTVNLWVNACKAIVVNGGDWNNSAVSIYMEGGGTLTLNGLNCEAITNSTIEVLAGALTVTSMSVQSPGGPIVSALGSSVNVSMGLISSSGTPGVNSLWNGQLIYYRTAGNEYPERLPRGGALVRYASTAWSTLNEGELTSRIYELPANRKRQPRIEDAFVSNYATTQIGALGWVLTAISGTTLTGRAVPAGPGNSFGVLETYFNNSTVTNEFRFGLPNEIQLGTTQYWEMRWALYVEDEANAKLRWGLYSLDQPLNANGTVVSTNIDIEPLYGVGFHVNRSTPDANIFAEVINNGVITRMDTGMAYTGLGTMKEYVITRNEAGLFFTIKNPLNQVPSVVVAQLKHLTSGDPSVVPSADYLSPSLFSGAANATFQQVFHDQFSLELFAP